MNAQTHHIPPDAAYLSILGEASIDVVLARDKRGRDYARLRVRVEVAGEINWLTVVAFDAGVVKSRRRVRKGDRVDASGRLQVRAWTDRDGSVCTWVGLVASTFGLIADAFPTEPPYDAMPHGDGPPFDLGSEHP